MDIVPVENGLSKPYWFQWCRNSSFDLSAPISDWWCQSDVTDLLPWQCWCRQCAGPGSLAAALHIRHCQEIAGDGIIGLYQEHSTAAGFLCEAHSNRQFKGQPLMKSVMDEKRHGPRCCFMRDAIHRYRVIHILTDLFLGIMMQSVIMTWVLGIFMQRPCPTKYQRTVVRTADIFLYHWAPPPSLGMVNRACHISESLKL